MLYRVNAAWRKGEYPLVVFNGSSDLCAAVAVLNLLTSETQALQSFSVSVSKRGEGLVEVTFYKKECVGGEQLSEGQGPEGRQGVGQQEPHGGVVPPPPEAGGVAPKACG